MDPISRRAALAAPALLLPGCHTAKAQSEASISVPLLRQIAPFPVGACAMTGQFQDPAFVSTLVSNFSQITPEWEMKMEAILKDDGTFDFNRPDQIADFAAQHGLRLHGHTLVWYAQEMPAFRRIDGAGKPFADAYRNYILAVAGRYRGRVVSWDVVNEAINENGEGERDCIWSRNLGPDYAALAYRHAQEADPTVPLFLNDYFLDTMPNKRRSFLRMAERILKSGAPLSGLGTQTHVSIHMQPGAIKAAIKDLASLGLPIHLSELDVSIRNANGVKGRFNMTPVSERLQHQARVVGEAMEAFMSLPAHQRFAFTIWGVRDKDSWLRRPPNAGDGTDRPLLFDDDARPKPAARAWVEAVSRI
jgi:endo-1,4-beta-xylanase